MIRVGMGYDVHRFEDGRELFLGGIKLSGSPGLKGHSDADVLLHAVIDAILGASGLGDIGEMFPDTDSSLKGVRSTLLLSKVMEKIESEGWRVVNIDSVLICEKPKILPWREKIRGSIAEMVGIGFQSVMVKGKTTEKLGFTGRGEGIAAQCVVLLEKEELSEKS